MSDLIHGDVRENKETDVDAVMEIYSELSEIHEEDDHERSNNAAVGTMTMAEKHVELVKNSARISGKDPVAMNAADTAGSLRADEYCTTGLHGEVNLGFKVESDEDDDFHFTQLVRSRSDDLLEIQRLNMTREIVENLEDSPSAVSEVNARDFVGIQQPTSQEQYKLEGSSCTDSPGLASQEGGAYETGTEDDEDYYIETDGDVRIALIEEEYVDRMTLLESRNYDLEVVLHRLTTAIERLLSLQDADMPNGETDEVPGSEMRTEVEADEFNEESNPEMGDIDSRKAEIQEAANDSEKIESATGDTTDIGHNTAKDSDALTDCNDTTDAPENASNPHKDTAGPTEDTIDGEMTTVKTEALIDSTAHVVSRNICIDLFIEFQKRLAMFAGELKGVLTCSDVAIRHARIFHEWGKSKQLLSEQLQHERKKMMSYIEEREKTMTVVRDQFKKELEEQGTKLENLVEEMTKYQNLMDTSDNLLKDKVVEYSQRRAVAESLTEVLLKRRLDEERSIILDLTKQSEISMMKLFIMHQQNCIQDLQIQNREQRAIIEGLMGPDDTEDDEPTDTDPTSTPVSAGTPQSTGTPERCPIRDVLNRGKDQSISLVSDVLYCDRSQYLPGISTDGDIATIQAYNLGGAADDVTGGASVEVVFDPLDVDYVRRQCRQAEETERRVLEEHVTGECIPDSDDGRTTPETDRGVMVLQDGVQPLNIEPYLRKRAAEERLLSLAPPHDAIGDGNDVTARKDVDVQDVALVESCLVK